jgi:hypothetical protein
MHVSGADVAKPCISFAHFGFDEALLDAIIKYGYSEPTGIQKQVFHRSIICATCCICHLSHIFRFRRFLSRYLVEIL